MRFAEAVRPILPVNIDKEFCIGSISCATEKWVKDSTVFLLNFSLEICKELILSCCYFSRFFDGVLPPSQRVYSII